MYQLSPLGKMIKKMSSKKKSIFTYNFETMMFGQTIPKNVFVRKNMDRKERFSCNKTQ